MTSMSRPLSAVAIYERDDLMHGLLREWLSGAGYAVRDSLVPSDPAAAVDLAIVSITMPKQESNAMLRGVQSLHPRIPIIALSSQARSGLSSDGTAARALGVERVLAKPLTRNELVAAVHAVIGPP
jgi:DNA-binding response OmpR family regulator